jgi:hypothetical protein
MQQRLLMLTTESNLAVQFFPRMVARGAILKRPKPNFCAIECK